MIEVTQARYFLILAEELNFSRAANRLNMSQPPLSRQIQQLEQQLDAALFERTSRRVILTPAGNALVPEARRLVAQADVAALAVRRAARVASGSMTIAFAGAMTYDILPRLVARARAELPEITLELVQMESTEQHEAIRAGIVDMGLSRPLPPTPLIENMHVAREPMMLAIPQLHPLAKRRRPPIDLIDGEDFISFSAAARYLHDKLNALFDAQGVQPNVVQRLTHSQAILSLVSVGIGMAIVPQEARNACFDNVVFRQLDRTLDCQAEIHANWLIENTNPALREFRTMLGSWPVSFRQNTGF